MISSPRLPVGLARARPKLQSFCAAAAATPPARASARHRRPTAGGRSGTTLGLEVGRWRSASRGARSALMTTRTSPTGITRGGGGGSATTTIAGSARVPTSHCMATTETETGITYGLRLIRSHRQGPAPTRRCSCCLRDERRAYPPTWSQ